MRTLLLAAAILGLSSAAFAQSYREREYRAQYNAQPSNPWSARTGWGENSGRRSSAPSWGLHHGENPFGSDANGN